MFDLSLTFRGVNTDFFFNFSDIFLISPTSDPSDFLLNRAVRAVCMTTTMSGPSFIKEPAIDGAMSRKSFWFQKLTFVRHLEPPDLIWSGGSRVYYSFNII